MIQATLARLTIDAGNPAEAETNIRYAMRLNPFHPAFYNGVLANALEQQGKETEAIDLLRSVVKANPNYFAGQIRLASLLGLAGEPGEALRHAEEARRINPRLNREGPEHFYTSTDRSKVERFLEGLEKAGIAL